jgi:hypothetical protein
MVNHKYLSPSSAAKFLDVSIHLLQKWRSLGIGVPYTKLGDSINAPIRYAVNDLEKYLEERKIKTM